MESKWFDVSKSARSNRQDEKFRRPHWTHSHDTFLRAKYIWSFIPIQSWWYKTLQESHCTSGVVHFIALLQTPHGHFGALGPGLGSGAYDRILQAGAYRGIVLLTSHGKLGPFSLTLSIAKSGQTVSSVLALPG